MASTAKENRKLNNHCKFHYKNKLLDQVTSYRETYQPYYESIDLVVCIRNSKSHQYKAEENS